MKRSLIDKIASGIVFVGTVVIFFVDYFKSFLAQKGLEELAEIIPFISALSLFCFIWSFIWDNKIIKLHKINNEDNLKLIEEERKTNDKLIAQSQNTTNTFINISKNLEDYVKAALTQSERIESRILFEKEKDLDAFLKIQSGGNEFAQIYVITNAATVENERFGKAICDNIIKNHQYVYVSPFDEEQFMLKLHNTLFEVCHDEYDKTCLEAAFQKNIRHLKKPELFSWLPQYSDIVIYVKKKIVNFDAKTEQYFGYFSFQDQTIPLEEVECYYYSKMSEAKASKIAIEIEKELKNQPNLSIQNYLSDSVEIRYSSFNGNGLFSKIKIKKGEVIFKKGGTFVLKEKLNEVLKNDIQYIQINDNLVVSSLRQEENTPIYFPINHSCRNPNCGFKNPIEIIAIQDIEAGQEILIDYAFFDLDYCKEFDCKGCTSGKCIRKSKNNTEILEELRNRKDVLSPYLREKI